MKNATAKKLTFFNRFRMAIVNLEDYDLFIIENPKTAFIYFAKLILLFSLIASVGITYKFANVDLSSIQQIQEMLTQEVIDYINNVPKENIVITFFIVSTIYLFITYYIMSLIDVFLLSILGMITAKFARIRIKYMPLISLCIYALTLSITLNAIYILINCFSGFEIKYFQIMYNLISYIYVITAIFIIKSEIIKQETELAKIALEQEKIKEENRRREEEENEEKKEDEEKPKEEKNDETPEGTSAIRKLDINKGGKTSER